MMDQHCLKLNNPQEKLKVAFGKIKSDKYFTDVTLACEDGQQVEAHKVILASSSRFFQNLLEKNIHPFPIIYMRGMKYDDLLAIVNLLYFDEANVRKENVDSFLKIAEELQLQGLTREVEGDKKSALEVENQVQPNMEKPRDQPPATANSPKIHTPQKEPKTDKKVVLSPEAKRDLKEIEERFNYIISKNRDINANQTAFMCKVCGKKDSDSAIIRNHIENDHAQEFNIPCGICQKRFRPGKALRKHKEIVHLPFWRMDLFK